MAKVFRCLVCNQAIKDGDTVVYRHGDLFHARCRDLPAPPTTGNNSRRRHRPSRRRS